MEAQFALSLGLIKLAQIVASSIFDDINREENAQKDIESIKSWSNTMRAFLYVYDEAGGDQILQDKFHQIQTFAYDIDDAIDEFSYQASGCEPTKPDRYVCLKICSNIKRIREKVDNFIRLDPLRNGISNNTNTAEDLNYARAIEIPLAPQFNLEDDVVGFECETEEIMSRLLSREPPRSLISLVGPAGSGKTALAHHVYESGRVRGRFDHRAWVSVSCPLNLQKALQDILMQFCDDMDKPNLSDEAILEALKRLLREKSCVIVLDGLWSKEECGSIIDALSKVLRNGRIIITSRISDVAPSCLHKYELKGLPPEKALTLFCKRAFHTGNGECPPDLVEWTEKIVKKCEGLPSSLVAAGNLLSDRTRIPREWKYVHDELEAELPIVRSQIIPSYKDLPGHLRLCFLYFSIFPEDYSIKRERLKRLWIAEGFVVERGSKKLEDVAEDNLNELARRNLIHVTARDVDGRVKSCRLLHLVHRFIVCKAEKENFVKILAERRRYSLDKVRRLSVRAKETEFLKAQNLNQTRSAFLFAEADCSFLPSFMLLKVLEMQGAPINSFPEGIVNLTLLRYLSLRQTKVSSVPRCIKRLRCLETLDLRQTLISWLPKAIRKLHSLRHLLVYRCEVKDSGEFDSVKGVEISSHLGISNWPSARKSEGRIRGDLDRLVKEIENSTRLTGTFNWPAIQKLSLLNADGMVLENLSKFTNLRKLGLIVHHREDGRKICESIQEMEHLSTLEIMTANERDYLELDHIPGQPGFIYLRRLYLKGGLLQLPSWISALHSLIKISLKWSRLNICPLKPLQTLPNLMQLELVEAYRGESLEFKADTFPKLKLLYIQQLDELRMLVIGENAISKLEKLKISRCGKLEVLPSGISKLTHLEELHLDDMPEDFIGEVEKNIQECRMMVRVRISRSD